MTPIKQKIRVNLLQNHLARGLAVVSELWNYKAKNWVTSICAADIDNDGDIEIIAGSRDGRVCALTSNGDVRWERIVGHKDWVGTIASMPQIERRGLENKDMAARIILGTRDGLVYALDKDGRTVSPTGERPLLAKDDEAFWFKSEHVIRQVMVSPACPTDILIGSEDRYVYLLDTETGRLRWQFPTRGWIRALFTCDINNDGEVETLLGSQDKYIYILNQQGECIAQKRMEHSIYTLAAADIDDDGAIEILVGTDGNNLIALDANLEHKWSQSFENRLLTLYPITLNGGCQIIAGSEDKHIYFLTGQGKIMWRHNLNARVFSIYACDINHDGQIEVLVGAEDDRVHALRVNLDKALSGTIRRSYQNARKLIPEPLSVLSYPERMLLQDLLQEDVREHLTQRQVTLKHAEHLIENHDYAHALADLLHLQQQKVQLLWHKDNYGHIRSVCFGDISGDQRREVIIATSEGSLYAFTTSGRQLWELSLGEALLSIQTGYLDKGHWETIIACSSDHHVYTISGVSGSKGQVKQEPSIKSTAYIDEWMTSLQVSTPNRQKPAEIIVGSADKKITVYKNNLQTPDITIPTPQGIKTVYACTSKNNNVPAIVAGSLKNNVYAYTRNGRLLWDYTTHDRVRAVCVSDIDGDHQMEIIIGSEDRNVHVLDAQGHLKWRYYLPHSVLTIDAQDADHDGKFELFLGCADGYLYVLNCEGELLWHYQAADRIRAVQVGDINDDGQIEIAVGSESQLEVLQIVDPRPLQLLIDHCWYELQKIQPTQAVIQTLLEHPDALLRAFALQKLIEQVPFDPSLFDTLATFSKDTSLEVRRAVVRALMICYATDPQQADSLLTPLSMDADEKVRQAFVEQIQHLVNANWEAGFAYLEGFSQNSNRLVRRVVLRQLSHLIMDSPAPYDHKILTLGLKLARDSESQWIQQEAARTLARYLDYRHDDILIVLFRCIYKGIKTTTLQQIVHNAQTPVVQHIFGTVVPLLTGLDDHNALERIEHAVSILGEVRSFTYGKDTQLTYIELQHLFRIRTLSEIADYHCHMAAEDLTPDNPHAPIILRICQQLGLVTRQLRIYLKREGLNDRLSSLLEAVNTIADLHKFVEREYATLFHEGSTKLLPDRECFNLLLQRWRGIVFAQLDELRGKADLQAELKTRRVPQEKQIGIWLTVKNAGRRSAEDVKVSLLHNIDFDIIGKNSFATEVIFSQEEAHAEFVIRPHTTTNNLCLNFEIIYDDAESSMQTLIKSEQLELQPAQQQFINIPNPYSTGTPTHNSEMFFGREEDIEFLRDNLTRTEAQTVLVLYGQRRSGKTSLLIHLTTTSVLGKHIPILVDMQKESYKISDSKFLYHLAFYIFKELDKRKIIVNKPLVAEFEQSPTFALDLFLEEVETQLTDRKIIVLIDEFEVLEAQVKKGKLEPELFEYLRSLMQHHTMINFLLSGIHKIEDLTRGYWSVFFNIALHHRLSRLSSESATNLITQPVAGYLEYEPYAVRKIRDLTANQPFLIHLVCRSLVDHCNAQRKTFATINDVNTVLHEVMQTGQVHFDWLWDQIASAERITLSVLAEGGKEEGRPLSLLEIEEIYRHYRIPHKQDQIKASLRELMAAQAIEKHVYDTQEQGTENNRYKIPVGLIRQWLLKEKTLEQTLKNAAL